MIQNDLFFTQVDGETFSSPLWLDPDIKRCHYLNSGFQYVWYPGHTMSRKVLAPVDHALYLETAYGPEFMIPQGIKSYRSVFMVGDIISTDYFNFKGPYLNGMSKAFHTMCTAYDTACPSSYAAETLWNQMVSFVHRIAKRKGLTYTLACESLRFLYNRKQLPPLYAAIAVPEPQATAWLSELKEAHHTSTFVLEHHSDGSAVHMRFSHLSPVRLVVWKLPTKFELKTKDHAKDSTHVEVMAAVNGENSDYLMHMCDTCELCEPTPKARVLFQGALVNTNTRLCVDVSYNRGTRAFACHFQASHASSV